MHSTAGNRAAELAAAAGRDLALAELADRPADRYTAAHLAALRAAAAVLAARPLAARPAPRRRRLTSAWDQLSLVAPELAEWAARFASGAAKRAAAEAGFRDVVTAEEADDLLAAARTFLTLTTALLEVEPAPLAG